MDVFKACWIWTGQKTKDGYGLTTFAGKRITVHRLVYILFNGPLPSDKGKEFHHICKNKACYNPFHLKYISKTEHLYLHPIHVGVHRGKEWDEIGIRTTDKRAVRERERRAKMWKEFKERKKEKRIKRHELL